MELPVAVQQALGDSAAGVSLRDAAQASQNQLLRMVLLSDGQGNLQDGRPLLTSASMPCLQSLLSWASKTWRWLCLRKTSGH